MCLRTLSLSQAYTTCSSTQSVNFSTISGVGLPQMIPKYDWPTLQKSFQEEILIIITYNSFDTTQPGRLPFAAVY